MKLILYTGKQFLPKENAYEAFILHSFYRLCERNTTDTFFFLPHDKEVALPANGHGIAIKHFFFNSLITKDWNRRILNETIRKNRVDILISLGGKPLPASVPQILILPENTGKATEMKIVKYAGENRLSCRVITHSGSTKRRLLSRGIEEAAVMVLPQSPGPRFQPYDWEKKEAVKQKFTQGKEYFLMPASGLSPDHIVTALKAFSQFKKWQQSNMQFVIAGKAAHSSKIQELLRRYKYREDVKILNLSTADPAYPELLSSGMAVVFFSENQVPDLFIHEALQCGVPVIMASKTLPEEDPGEAVLHADIPHLADQMVKLYKDEKFRSTLIEKGKEQVSPLSETNARDRLWNFILHTASR